LRAEAVEIADSNSQVDAETTHFHGEERVQPPEEFTGHQVLISQRLRWWHPAVLAVAQHTEEMDPVRSAKTLLKVNQKAV